MRQKAPALHAPRHRLDTAAMSSHVTTTPANWLATSGRYSPRMIEDGYRLLFELGAVDEKKELTKLARVRIDMPNGMDAAAVLRLAAPLMMTNAIQAVLNLTDTWFVGRISTTAVLCTPVIAAGYPHCGS